ncbi:MAG TPA: DUF1573 domain-containing protein [Pirellulaceae bacterium]|nr:DUF1573 domain-containing protein [Pirellulaceae bacterium]
MTQPAATSRKFANLAGALLATILGLLVLSSAEFIAHPDAAAPHATLPSTKHDLGIVFAGGVLEARFAVSNEGGRRLILVEQAGSCECLRAGQEEVVIRAGGSGELVAQLDSREVRGPVRMQLTYLTNDPRRPKIELLLLADIVAPPSF